MMLNRGQQQGIDDKSRVPQLQVGRWMRAMVEVVGAGGAREQVDVYVDPSTETAYEKVRSLADTRMGKAYHYQTLELQAQAQAAGGGSGGGGVYVRTGRSVLVKSFLKQCVAGNCDTEGKPSGERPFRENQIAQFLSTGGAADAPAPPASGGDDSQDSQDADDEGGAAGGFGARFFQGNGGSDLDGLAAAAAAAAAAFVLDDEGGEGEEGNSLPEPMAGVQEDGHDNVPEYFGFFEAEGAYAAVMEFVAGGELYNVVEAHGSGLLETTARSLFSQMARGVRYLHRCGVAHLDLSPENFVVTADLATCKVIDFGLARVVRSLAGGLMRGWCGKTFYAPPEMNVPGAYYDPHLCDVWSLGVTLFVVLFGGPPFKGGARMTDPVYKAMARHDDGIAGIVAYWRATGVVGLPPVSDTALDLVRRMMCPDPARRITMEGVMEHDWMTAAQ